MTDQQLLTLALAVIFPLSMLICSNSRITEAKETLRAEMAAGFARVTGELSLTLQRIENKLDHYAEIQASHAERIERLEKRS